MTPLHDVVRLGYERRKLKIRARLSQFQVLPLSDRTEQIEVGDILLTFCVRNELPRLPFFLQYYRNLGVKHFLAIDNASSDGSAAYLMAEKDVSVWQSNASYKKARFGMDWINRILSKHAAGHWVLAVDPDEFFVYPHQDSRPLQALIDWLDASRIRSFGAMLIDMYPKAAPSNVDYQKGQDPLEVAPFFDPQNYQSRIEKYYFNLWIQGGPRQRVFFRERPGYAPALNKIPLVKWSNDMVFRSSTHQMLPRSLNVTYSQSNLPKTCGALLHFKFLDLLLHKSSEELHRKEHFAAGREYRAYIKRLENSLWTEYSARYEDWQQLEKLGLMSRGDWV